MNADDVHAREVSEAREREDEARARLAEEARERLERLEDEARARRAGAHARADEDHARAEAARAATEARASAGEAPGASERMRVLEMVAEGKLSAQEAAELLAALGPEPEPEPARPGRRGPFGPDFPFGPRGPFGPGGPFAQGGALGAATSGTGVGPRRVPAPAAPRAMGQRSLVFDIRDDEKKAFARLPLGLVQNADRFLPREVRQYLAEYEVDLGQLVELLNNMDAPHPGPMDLLDMRDGERRIKISVE